MSKVSCKDVFCGISIKGFKNKRTFIKKKLVRHTTTMMHWKARQGFLARSI